MESGHQFCSAASLFSITQCSLLGDRRENLVVRVLNAKSEQASHTLFTGYGLQIGGGRTRIRTWVFC